MTKRLERTWREAEWARNHQLDKPFAVFVALMPYYTSESIQRLVMIPPPHKFHKVDVPQDLQQATFGTLVRLQNVDTSLEYQQVCCALVEVLTGIPAKRVASSRAFNVLGMVNMIKTEMERIGKLFNSLHTDHTSEEMAAGIDKLSFGAFGIVDWYAKRMGIIDHEEVFNTPWARIYQCMKIDFENNEFEKRYRKILENRSKRK